MADGKPDSADEIDAYLDFLRREHPHYPDCCTYHVQHHILVEHAVTHGLKDRLDA